MPVSKVHIKRRKSRKRSQLINGKHHAGGSGWSVDKWLKTRQSEVKR